MANPFAEMVLMTSVRAPLAARGIARPRLAARLAASAETPLTLLVAATGWGKTTALSQWAKAHQGPLAWLALSAADDDQSRLLTLLCAALLPAVPAVAAVPIVGREQPQDPTLGLTRLINALDAWGADHAGERLTLVIDDLHHLQSASQLFVTLIDHLPPQVRVIAAARGVPALPLARWRARGLCAEITTNELRFQPEETARYMAETMGLKLPESALSVLDSRIEGWIAGLHLAALSAQQQRDPADYISKFTGSHRYLFDYLAEEVLATLDPETMTFLLATSILDELCGPLCDAVLAGAIATPAQAILERIERAQLFIVPLDDERRWYRYHQLFGELLRLRLDQHGGFERATLHRRASAWLAEAGLIEASIGHSLAANDEAQAAALVIEHARAALMRGEARTVQRWIARLPQARLAEDPELALAAAWAFVVVAEIDPAAQYAELARQGLMALAPPLAGRMREELQVIEAIIPRFSGDFAAAVERSLAAQATVSPDDDVLQGIIAGNLAVAQALRGDLAGAAHAAAQAKRANIAAGNALAALLAITDLGMLQVQLGQLQSAELTLQEGLALAAERGWSSVPGLGLIRIALGLLACERNDLPAAQLQIESGIRLARNAGYDDIACDGLTALARVLQAFGSGADALEALDAAWATAARSGVARFQQRVVAARMRILVLQGRSADARQLAAAYELPAQELGPDQLPLALAHLWLALDSQDDAGAQLLLKRIEPAIGARRGPRIELALAQALLDEHQKRPAASLEALEEALLLAEEGGFLRIVLEAHPAVIGLVRRLAPKLEAARPFALILLAEITAPEEPGGTEAFTPREREILLFLASGATMAKIGSALGISPATIKRHAMNLYGKLGVHGRMEALRKARRLGLIGGRAGTDPAPDDRQDH